MSELPRTGSRPAGSLVRSGALLGTANAIASACGYAITLVLSRALGPADFGAMGALLAVGLIGTIPAGALQVVCARWRATTTTSSGQPPPDVAWGGLVGIGLLGASVFLARPVAALLHLDSPLPMVLLGLTLLPMSVTGALQGRLLGSERYRRLATVNVVVAVARLGAAVGAAVAGFGIDGVLVVTAAAAALALGVAALLGDTRRDHGAGAVSREQLRELVGAATAMAGLLVLTNLDVLLARHYLDPKQAGLYALASIFTKAAFWGPQFISLLVLPQLSRQERRTQLLARAASTTLGLGMVVVAVAAAAAGPIVRFTAGPEYTSVATTAWLFAVLGVVTAVLQLLLYAGLAVSGHGLTRVLWGAAALEVLLVVVALHGSVGEILAAALLSTGVIVVVGGLRERRDTVPRNMTIPVPRRPQVQVSSARAPAAAGGYNPGLDGLRAVAVLAVLLYHGQVSWARGGFLGVDVFFVLSGFLITDLLLRERSRWGSIDLRSFWLRRARRLLPALLVVLLFCSAYGVVWAATDKLSQLRQDALATLFYVANWHFIASGQSYFDQYGDPSPLRHMWSLAIEEQFYLLWPLLLTGLVVLTRGRRRAATWALVAAAGASALLMRALYTPGGDPSRVYYGTDTRAEALLVGAALALALGSVATVHGDGAVRFVELGMIRLRAPRASAFAWVALAGLVASFLLARETSSWLYQGGFLVVAALSAIVIAGASVVDSGVSRLLSWRPLRLIGVVSYGLYLWHWPLYVVLSPERIGLTGSALLGVRLCATLLAAVGSFLVVEQPIRRGALRRPPAPVARIAIAGSVLLVAGATVAATSGAVSANAPAAVGASTTQGAGVDSPDGTAAVTAYLVGDSVPFNLRSEYPGNEVPGLAVEGSTLLGCGLLPYARMVDGTLHPLTEDCNGWVRSWEEDVAQRRPDVGVIFVGIGEQFDHVVDGRTIRFGSPEYARHLRRDLASYVDHMSSAAHAVALVTDPCHDVMDTGLNPEASVINDASRARWLNRVIASVADQRANVHVLDLNAELCSAGYTNTRNGVTLRKDGLHFTHDGAGLVWDWLGPQLLSLGRT